VKEKSKEKDKKNSNENFPKNINEYRHIIDTLQINDKELGWVLELRTYGKMNPGYEKVGAQNPFNFTNNDIPPNKKYKDLSYKGNLRMIDHLTRKRIGANANFSQLEFETSLRNLKPFHNVHPPTQKWDNIIGINDNKNKTQTTFLPPMTKDNIKTFYKLEKDNLVTRPTGFALDKTDYFNQHILVRKMSPKNVSTGYLGEHVSLPKYDENYYHRNFNETRHILCHTANNSASKWTCGLRGFSSNPRKNVKLDKSPEKDKDKPQKQQKSKQSKL